MTAFNSKVDSKIGHGGIQLKLWDRPNLDPTAKLKSAMQEALKNSILSREQVVDEINRLALQEGFTTGGRAQKVTLPILDKWLAPGATSHIIPTRYLPLFCKVVGSLLPLQALAAPLAADVIPQEKGKLLQWAELEVERRRLQKMSKKLAQEAGIE